MRIAVLLTLAGVMSVSGLGLAQDPDNAFIPDIQNGVFPENTFVTIRDVVVTGIAEPGLWIQEPAPTSFPRSGIWCYTSTTPQVAIGDKVDLSGVYTEYFDVSEIDVTQGGSIVNTGLETVPAPVVLTPFDLANLPTAEDWEGVLVRVENVEVQGHLDFGEYLISPIGNPLDLLTCDDRSLTSPTRPPIGAQFVSITGVHDYTFNEFKMQPRNNDDFDWLAGEPAPLLEIAYCISGTEVVVVFDRDVQQSSAEDPINYFFNNLGEFADTATLTAADEVLLTVLTPFTVGNPVPEQLDVSNVANQAGTPMGTESTTFIAGINTIDFVQTIGSGLDSSQVAGEVVTVEGIVTGDNDNDYIAPDGNRYYIEMPGGGPLSGIFVFDRRHRVRRGDELRVAGRVLEYFFKTEIDDPPFVEILSRGNPIPGPDLVTPLTLSSSASAEPWEGVFVRVENVVVNQDTTFGFGEWTITSSPGATDTTVIGDEGVYTYDPTVGDPHAFIQGPLDYSFGDPKIQPRDDADIQGSGVGVAEMGAPTARTELLGGFPNPFNPAATLRFSLRAAGTVSLKIYDGQGRLVRTLLDNEVVESGIHEVAWDGRDDRGRQLASGVYLSRFQAGAVSESRKLALVK